MNTFTLRRPAERLANCVWLARLTDKARLHHQQKLPEEYAPFLGHPRGIDGQFLHFFALDKDSTISALGQTQNDVEAEQWFISQPNISETKILEWNTFAPDLGRKGHPGEAALQFMWKRMFGENKSCPVETLFELIEWDESPKSII